MSKFDKAFITAYFLFTILAVSFVGAYIGFKSIEYVIRGIANISHIHQTHEPPQTH